MLLRTAIAGNRAEPASSRAVFIMSVCIAVGPGNARRQAQAAASALGIIVEILVTATATSACPAADGCTAAILRRSASSIPRRCFGFVRVVIACRSFLQFIGNRLIAGIAGLQRRRLEGVGRHRSLLS